MLNEILVSSVAALVVSGIFFLFGLAIFKNDQKNKNLAMETRFENTDKDISKNDQRLRREIEEQNHRIQKELDNQDREIHSVRNGLTRNVQDMVEVKTMMLHLDKSVSHISQNVDTILKHMMNNTKMGNPNEK